MKVFIINDDNEILFAKSDGGVQLIGGHVEIGETYEQAVVREINEETGISIEECNILPPFFEIKHYTKNYHDSGKNRMSNVLYYYLKTNCKPNTSNINLTEDEAKKQFSSDYISMEQFEEYVKSYLNNEKEINRTIAKEILVVFDELKNILKT